MGLGIFLGILFYFSPFFYLFQIPGDFLYRFSFNSDSVKLLH